MSPMTPTIPMSPMSHDFEKLFFRQREILAQIEAAATSTGGEPDGRLRRVAQIAAWGLDIGRTVPEPADVQAKLGDVPEFDPAPHASDPAGDVLDEAAPMVSIGNLVVLPLGMQFITLVNGSPVQASRVTIHLAQDDRPRVELAFTADDEDPRR